jgi:hypothetical protein
VLAVVAALALVVFLLLRPMEIWEPVGRAWPLETLTALAALGIGWDWLARRQRVTGTPQLPWLLAFLAAAYAVTIARLGLAAGFKVVWSMTTLPAIFMIVVTFGVRGRRRLAAFAISLGACFVLIAGVAVHQGLQPQQCVAVEPGKDGADETYAFEGRPCEWVRECEEEGRADVDYLCEKVGAFGTFTTGKRVRWRGQLADPNELSVFVGATLPLLFVTERSRKRWVLALVILPAVLLSLVAVAFSQSRGGQVALATVACAYFVRRFGLRGVLITCALAAPLVLFAWREGAEADSSAIERAQILREGLALLRARPIVGVGVGQFMQEIDMPHTAHNAYLLAATELGVPGYFAWFGLLWMSIKIPVSIAIRPPAGLDPAIARFASALSLSFGALVVGIFFLSFTYKQLLFIFLGLAGALYGTVRAAHPHFEVRTTKDDLKAIAVVGSTFLVAVWLLARVRTG